MKKMSKSLTQEQLEGIENMMFGEFQEDMEGYVEDHIRY